MYYYYLLQAFVPMGSQNSGGSYKKMCY